MKSRLLTNIKFNSVIAQIASREKTVKNFWVFGSNPILANSFHFGVDLKGEHFSRTMLGDRCMQDVCVNVPYR